MSPAVWEGIVRVLGLAQTGMAVLGAILPAALGWRRELAPLRPFYRRLFWVYGTYVLGTNLFFGLLLALWPALVLQGGPAGGAIALYLLLFWAGRLGLELAGFDRDALPGSLRVRRLRWALGGVLAGMVLGYAAVVWRAFA